MFMSRGCIQQCQLELTLPALTLPTRLLSPPIAADFESVNCLREVVAAIDLKKPRILVHEADTLKGGATLEELRMELTNVSHRIAIFSDDKCVIRWFRLVEFQYQSLLLVVQQMLMASPTYRQKTEPLKLTIPGSIMAKPLVFPYRVELCECRCSSKRQASLLFACLYRDRVLMPCLPQTSPRTTQAPARQQRRWRKSTVASAGLMCGQSRLLTKRVAEKVAIWPACHTSWPLLVSEIAHHRRRDDRGRRQRHHQLSLPRQAPGAAFLEPHWKLLVLHQQHSSCCTSTGIRIEVRRAACSCRRYKERGTPGSTSCYSTRRTQHVEAASSALSS